MNLRTRGLHTGYSGNRLLKLLPKFPSRKPLFYFFSFIFQCNGMLPVLAQKPGLTCSIRYREESKTFYQVTDPFADFSIPDKVKLLPVIKKDSIVRMVDQLNNITTTIYHIENSKLEDWMTHPAKTVIDPWYVVSYDASGKVLSKFAHSKKYLELSNDLRDIMTTNKLDVIPTYFSLTEEMKTALIDTGFVYQMDKEGNETFTKDSTELIFNNKTLTSEIREYYGNGELKYSERNGFKINALGQTVPSFRIENRDDNTFSGHCVHQVTITTYPSYEIDYVKGREMENEISENDLLISPNPATADLNVMLPQQFENVMITVADNTGRIVIHEKMNAIAQFSIDINNIEQGIYLLSVEADGKTYSGSFVKN